MPPLMLFTDTKPTHRVFVMANHGKLGEWKNWSGSRETEDKAREIAARANKKYPDLKFATMKSTLTATVRPFYATGLDVPDDFLAETYWNVADEPIVQLESPE